MSVCGLTAFGPEIWTAEGADVAVLGFRYPTRMVVVRLADGALWLWSPVAYSAALHADVAMLGEVRHIVAPNSLHHRFLADWGHACPEARLYAAPGLRQKRPDIAFDAELDDAPPAEWAGDIDQVVVRGNLITTEVLFFHRRSRSILFTDLLQQFRPGWFSGWRALVARLDVMTGSAPSVPRKFRAATMDRKVAHTALTIILSWPIDRILMAHGPPVETGGHAVVARAFRWLRR